MLTEERRNNIIKAMQVCWYNVCMPEGFGGRWNDLDNAIERAQFLIVLAMNISGLVAVGILIYGGITFIMAGGDAEQIDKGQKILINAMIGLVIIFIARLIVTFVIDAIIGA